MFHFPVSPPTPAIYSPVGNHTLLRLGFPIRTSSDQRLVGSSPRLNAASHVLHRLDMPRHPPCALKTNTPTPTPQGSRCGVRILLRQSNTVKERCWRTLYSTQRTQ